MKFFTIHSSDTGSRFSVMEGDASGTREVLSLLFKPAGGIIANLDVNTMQTLEQHPMIASGIMTKALTKDFFHGYLIGKGYQHFGS